MLPFLQSLVPSKYLRNFIIALVLLFFAFVGPFWLFLAGIIAAVLFIPRYYPALVIFALFDVLFYPKGTIISMYFALLILFFIAVEFFRDRVRSVHK